MNIRKTVDAYFINYDGMDERSERVRTGFLTMEDESWKAYSKALFYNRTAAAQHANVYFYVTCKRIDIDSFNRYKQNEGNRDDRLDNVLNNNLKEFSK